MLRIFILLKQGYAHNPKSNNESRTSLIQFSNSLQLVRIPTIWLQNTTFFIKKRVNILYWIKVDTIDWVQSIISYKKKMHFIKYFFDLFPCVINLAIIKHCEHSITRWRNSEINTEIRRVASDSSNVILSFIISAK